MGSFFALLFAFASHSSDFNTVETRLPSTLNPAVAVGTRYVASREGLCMRLPAPATLNSPFTSKSGGFETWVRPLSPMGDSQTFLEWGGGGGIVVLRDGAKNTRIILNRYSPQGYPEQGVSIPTPDWQPGRWQHIAVTWNQAEVILSVNGQVEKRKLTSPLYPVSDQRMSLGSANIDLDDLRMTSSFRGELDLRKSFWNASKLSSLGLTQVRPSVVGWNCNLKLEVLADGYRRTVPFEVVDWSTQTPETIRFKTGSGPYSIKHGEARITAKLSNLTSNLGLMIQKPLLPPVHEQLTSDMTTSDPQALWEVPIAVAVFLPTKDKTNLDAGLTNWTATLETIRDRVLRENRLMKIMWQEASRFRGYKNGAAKPSLGTKIVKYVVFFEDIPRGIQIETNPPAYFPDYGQIVDRLGGRNLVEYQGVKEFWIWHWHHGEVVPVESNMSSPLTGDISNSFRHEDLPVYAKTYTVYGFNYTGNANLHNQGHQLESILTFVNHRQTGNTNLFDRDFVGIVNGQFQRGRAGSCHHPPNAESDYDYFNPNQFLSDCEDWRPDGLGAKTLVNNSTWESVNYPFPSADRLRVPGTALADDAHYYIYWNQNFPGRDNTIPMVGGGFLNNWWRFVGDYDNAIREGYGLFRP